MLSVKQDGIKYHFLSLWYDSTWDWTAVSRTIGKRYQLIGQTVRVFANGPGDRDSIPGRVMPKTQKVVLGASLFNTHSEYRIHL